MARGNSNATTQTPTVQLDAMNKGDTSVFAFYFPQPYVGFSWTGITADIAMTAQTKPTDNSSAGAYLSGVTAVLDSSNGATFSMQLTESQSKALATAGYKVQAKIHDVGGTNVVRPLTALINVVQEYVV